MCVLFIVYVSQRVLIGIGGSREHPEYISVFKLNNSFMIVTHQQARVSPDIADIAQVLKGLGV